MTEYIKVTGEGQDPIEIPSEDDGTLLLTTLSSQFPRAIGLKYQNPETGAFRALKVKDGVVTGPAEGWGLNNYIPVIGAAPAASNTVAMFDPNAKSERCSRVFVGNLPWSMSEADQLKEYFPDAKEVSLPKHIDTGKIKGFGYLIMESDDAADALIKDKDGLVIDGRKVNLDFAPYGGGPAKRRAAMMQPVSDACERLYVGNLPWSIGTADGLKVYFPTATNVSVPVHTDTGKIKGYGYISYATTEEAARVLQEKTNMEIEGRVLKLDFAPYGPGRRGGGMGGMGMGMGGMGMGMGMGGRGFGRGMGGGGYGGGYGGGRGGFGGYGRGGGGGRGGYGNNNGGYGGYGDQNYNNNQGYGQYQQQQQYGQQQQGSDQYAQVQQASTTAYGQQATGFAQQQQTQQQQPQQQQQQYGGYQ